MVPKECGFNQSETLPLMRDTTNAVMSAGVSCGKIVCHSFDIMNSAAKEFFIFLFFYLLKHIYTG